MAKKKEGLDWGSWVIIFCLFGCGLWPLALFLLFSKLFGKDEKKKSAPPLHEAAPSTASRSASQRRSVKAAKKVVKSPLPKKSNATILKVAGFVMALLGVMAMAEPLGMIFTSIDWLGLWLEDFLAGLALGVGGVAMAFSGVSMDKSLRRYAKYLAIMGDREAISFDELSRITGYSRRKVGKDLEKMVDKGYFGGKAYLNMELGYFFRSTDAQKKRQAPPPKETESGYSGILRNIRRANDCIADPILSAKIEKLEEITAKIFREVEAHPEKRERISTFLGYYLPTTQKLLDSYADFEAAGIEGENLKEAKSRIEATMDSIVAGFAHQLDQLYQGDAMDVESDIRVMETMLRRDTARVEDDFDLSGTAVAREEE